jgi:hypothetical protein
MENVRKLSLSNLFAVIVHVADRNFAKMVFMIDLPRIDDSCLRATNKLTPFGEDLCYFLTAQGLDGELVGSLTNYDFAETARYGFIHTMWVFHRQSILFSLTAAAAQAPTEMTRGSRQVNLTQAHCHVSKRKDWLTWSGKDTVVSVAQSGLRGWQRTAQLALTF